MYNRILIAEDHESASISVRKAAEELGITQPHYVYYCDDALASIHKKQKDGLPYELLITDLYFEEDGVAQQVKGGQGLIREARKLQPDLPVLVFSAEHSAAIIDLLFRELQVNGYVRKARHDIQELKNAINTMAKGKVYTPQQIKQFGNHPNAHNFTDFDIVIITLLSRGMLQKDIPAYLLANQIRPASLSSLEKRLNHIKEVYSFSKNEQLIAFCKDMRLL